MSESDLLYSLDPYTFNEATGAVSYETGNGSQASLQDIETYRDTNGQRRFVGLWRDDGQSSLLQWDMATLTEEPPNSDDDYKLVDFECYSQGSSKLYIGLWRTGEAPEERTFEPGPMALDELSTDSDLGRVVDIEQCDASGPWVGPEPGDSDARFAVLMRASTVPGLNLSRADWEGFHSAFHANPLSVVELESFPIRQSGGEVSGWEYVWLSKSDSSSLGTACQYEGRQAQDWMMATPAWAWLEDEVLCRAGAETQSETPSCGPGCHQSLQLVDVLIGADELPESDWDHPQHKSTHGGGSGGRR